MREVPFSAGLRAGDLMRLRPYGRVESFARRRIVALDGASVVFIVSGLFRIFRHAAFVRDVTLGLGAGGDVLCPGAAFGDRSAETGAETIAGGEVLFMTAQAWSAAALSEPDLQLRMAASVGKRLVRLQRRLEELSRVGAYGRVAACLVDMANDFGTPCEAGITLELPCSQEDLARLAGTTRETCSSAVAEFARRGYLRGARLRAMLIADVPALRALADAGA